MYRVLIFTKHVIQVREEEQVHPCDIAVFPGGIYHHVMIQSGLKKGSTRAEFVQLNERSVKLA
jgi:hypothetical protein